MMKKDDRFQSLMIIVCCYRHVSRREVGRGMGCELEVEVEGQRNERRPK